MNAANTGTRTNRSLKSIGPKPIGLKPIGFKPIASIENVLPTWVGDGLQTESQSSHPAAVEFASLLRPWLAEDAILLEDVDAAEAGVIDLVLVGAVGTIGIQFDTRAVTRPAPYFTDFLYVMSPLDVIDSSNELLYILMKSMSGLFSERARHQLPRLARIDKFKFTKPKQDGFTAYEISSVSRRTYPVVMQVVGSGRVESPVAEPVTPVAA